MKRTVQDGNSDDLEFLKNQNEFPGRRPTWKQANLPKTKEAQSVFEVQNSRKYLNQRSLWVISQLQFSPLKNANDFLRLICLDLKNLTYLDLDFS